MSKPQEIDYDKYMAEVSKDPGLYGTRAPEEWRLMQELFARYQALRKQSPRSLIDNKHLEEWPDGLRTGRAVAHYVPEGPLRDRYAAHDTATRYDLLRDQVPGLTERERLDLAAAVKKRFLNGLADVCARQNADLIEHYRARDAVRPNDLLKDPRFLAREFERDTHVLMEMTPHGPVVHCTLPAIYLGLPPANRNTVNARFADEVLRQVQENEKPGSTNDLEKLDQIRRLAVARGDQLTTRDSGGVINLGEPPGTGPLGQVPQRLAASASRGGLVIDGVTEAGKSAMVLSMFPHITFEPKANEVDAMAYRLQEAGFRAMVVDTRPRADARELTAPSEPRFLDDYLRPTRAPVPHAGFDPIGGLQNLVGPGGFEFARVVGEEIYSSHATALEAGRSRENNTNIRLFMTPGAGVLGSFLVASALETMTAPQDAPRDFWQEFHNLWRIPSGNRPSPETMTRIEALQAEGKIPASPPEDPFQDSVFRQSVVKALLRDSAQRAREAGLQVDEQTLDNMVDVADNFAAVAGKAGAGEDGVDIPWFFFLDGEAHVKDAMKWLAQPGGGLTVRDILEKDLKVCVKMTGENGEPVDPNVVWLYRVIGRQATAERDRVSDIVRDELRGDVHSPRQIMDAFGGRIPNQSVRELMSPQDWRAALDRGWPEHQVRGVLEAYTEFGALIRAVDPEALRTRMAIGGSASTPVYLTPSLDDLFGAGVNQAYLAGQRVIGVGHIHEQDEALMRMIRNATAAPLEPSDPVRLRGGGRSLEMPLRQPAALEPPSDEDLQGMNLGRATSVPGCSWFDDVPKATQTYVLELPRPNQEPEALKIAERPTSYHSLCISTIPTFPAVSPNASLLRPHSADRDLAFATATPGGMRFEVTRTRSGLDVVRQLVSGREAAPPELPTTAEIAALGRRVARAVDPRSVDVSAIADGSMPGPRRVEALRSDLPQGRAKLGEGPLWRVLRRLGAPSFDPEEMRREGDASPTGSESRSIFRPAPAPQPDRAPEAAASVAHEVIDPIVFDEALLGEWNQLALERPDLLMARPGDPMIQAIGPDGQKLPYAIPKHLADHFAKASRPSAPPSPPPPPPRPAPAPPESTDEDMAQRLRRLSQLNQQWMETGVQLQAMTRDLAKELEAGTAPPSEVQTDVPTNVPKAPSNVKSRTDSNVRGL